MLARWTSWYCQWLIYMVMQKTKPGRWQLWVQRCHIYFTRWCNNKLKEWWVFGDEYFIPDLLLSPVVKEFWNSFIILWNYGQDCCGTFFDSLWFCVPLYKSWLTLNLWAICLLHLLLSYSCSICCLIQSRWTSECCH